MPKTNFERLVEGVFNTIKTKIATASVPKEQLKLTADQAVIEISVLVDYHDATKKSIEDDIKEFYEKAPIPFVEIFDTDIFTTHTRGKYIALASFKVLVAATPRVAREEMALRCHKIVETERTVLAFMVKVDKNYV